jgi:hypothetical protein
MKTTFLAFDRVDNKLYVASGPDRDTVWNDLIATKKGSDGDEFTLVELPTVKAGKPVVIPAKEAARCQIQIPARRKVLI